MSPPPDIAAVLDADWLGVSRRAVARVREMLATHPEAADRHRLAGGRGEGGDMSLAIDRRAEDLIVDEVERLGLPLRVVTEERGVVEVAGGGPATVVIDPIDGSLNAKRRLPMHSVSIAVAEGDSLADVVFGLVHDLGTGEDWWARRGEGAFLADDRIEPLDPEASLELLGIESANPRIVAAAAEALRDTGAHRLRAIGSIALTLSWVAGGRLDGMLSLYDCRSVDAAAGQLIVREAGGAVAFPDAGEGLADAGLGLDMRSRVVAGATPAILEQLLASVPREAPERSRPAPDG